MKLELTDTKPGLFDSKVGGVGYVPRDAKIPEDSEGTQLRLLAQINCAEITLEDFPRQGLLQFWILNDDASGLNFTDITLQDTFRVLYYKEPDRTVTEKEVCEKMQDVSSDEEDYFPVRGCYGLHSQQIWTPFLPVTIGLKTVSRSWCGRIIRRRQSSCWKIWIILSTKMGKTGAAAIRSAVILGSPNGILVVRETLTMCCCFSWTVITMTARTGCCGATAVLGTSSSIGKN